MTVLLYICYTAQICKGQKMKTKNDKVSENRKILEKLVKKNR